MFSSISWFNVLVLLIIGLIVIGPERLPGMIKDMRAVALAFRNLVKDARRQLDDDFGPELKEFQKPLSQLNEYRRMGPRGLVTKALFDDDESFFDDLEDTSRQLRDTVNSVTNPLAANSPSNPAGNTLAERPASQAPRAAQQTGTTPQPAAQQPTGAHGSGTNSAGTHAPAQQGSPGAGGTASGSQPPSQGHSSGQTGASVWDDVL